MQPITTRRKNRGGPLEFFFVFLVFPKFVPLRIDTETGIGDDTCHVDVFYPFYYSPDPEGGTCPSVSRFVWHPIIPFVIFPAMTSLITGVGSSGVQSLFRFLAPSIYLMCPVSW